MTIITRLFDRISRNDQMRSLARQGTGSNAQIARRVYRDIYYI